MPDMNASRDARSTQAGGPPQRRQNGMFGAAAGRVIRDAIEAIRSGAVQRPANLPGRAVEAIDEPR